MKTQLIQSKPVPELFRGFSFILGCLVGAMVIGRPLWWHFVRIGPDGFVGVLENVIVVFVLPAIGLSAGFLKPKVKIAWFVLAGLLSGSLVLPFSLGLIKLLA